MEIEIHHQPIHFDLYGIAQKVTEHSYAVTGRKMMDRLWNEIKLHSYPHKGINIWAYLPDQIMMTAVEMKTPLQHLNGLEFKYVEFTKYAYYKHIGSYSLISEAYTQMAQELDSRGIQHHIPMVEIYGHWQPDETKLVTELIWQIE